MGIAIKKTIGKAVIRNKIRRRLTAILDERLDGLAPVRLILDARPEAARATFAQLRADVERGLG